FFSASSAVNAWWTEYQAALRAELISAWTGASSSRSRIVALGEEGVMEASYYLSGVFGIIAFRGRRTLLEIGDSPKRPRRIGRDLRTSFQVSDPRFQFSVHDDVKKVP